MYFLARVIRPLGLIAAMEDPDEEKLGVIRPNLIEDLRKILTEYPDNGQILKELIQNAEDAGARRVKILTDRRRFNADLDRNMLSQHHYRLYFTGPALCVYNDAVFTEDDWRGIRMLHLSIKEKDPLKVGRFGLGFKSVFHITDRAVIISGDTILYMNPFEDETQYCTKKRISKLKETELNEMLHCVGGPLCGISRETFKSGAEGLRGTLFWFSLRQSASELSSTVYDDKRLDDLLRAFAKELSSMLLFLNHTEQIEVCSRKDESAQEQLLLSVSLDACCMKTVHQERMSFRGKIPEQDGSLPADTVCSITNLTFKIQDNLGKSKEESHSWTVINYYPGRREMSAKEVELCGDPELSYRPCVGVALPVEKDHGFQGHIFCALPLPVESRSPTGLPVHVNGFFALSMNRNQVKWPDQQRQREHMQKTDKWNLFLVEKLLPTAYARLLEWLSQNLRIRPQAFYDFWPSMEQVTDHWRSLAERLYMDVATKDFFFTEANGGRWITLRQSVLRDFPPSVRPEVADAVAKVYNVTNQSMVELPRHVMDGLGKQGLLTSVTRVSAGVVSSLVPQCLARDCVARTDRLHVLEYLCDHGQPRDLLGLQLLPLADGKFSVFANDSAVTVYWCEKDMQTMFPGLDACFCDTNLSQSMRARLQRLANSGCFSLRVLQANDTALPSLIHRSYQNISNNRHLIRPWVEKVWRFLSANHPWSQDLERFRNLSLLPHNEELLTLRGIYICSTVQGMPPLSVDLVACLKTIGVEVLSALPAYVTQHAQVLGKLVQYPSADGVLLTLQWICKDENQMRDAVESFNKFAKDPERKALLSLVAAAKSGYIEPELVKFFQQLKIFTEIRNSTFVSIEEVNDIAPKDVPPIPSHLPCQFLSCTKGNSLDAAIKLGAHKTTTKDIALRVLQFMCSERDSFTPTDVDTFMSYFLNNRTLMDDEGLLSAAQEAKFLQNRSGQFVTAGDMYDPTSAVLTQLFYSEDKFPTGTFSKKAFLSQMRKLGLRTEECVRPEDLLESAQRIEQSIQNEETAANKKADGLWRFLVNHGITFHSRHSSIFTQLSKITCIPSLKESERPDSYPKPLSLCQRGIVKPNELCPLTQIALVGSVLPVTRQGLSDHVARALHIGSQMNLDHVLQQADHMIESFNQKTTEATKCINQKRQVRACADIYKYLSQLLEEQGTDTADRIASHLSKKDSVWTSAGFVAPWRVAFKSDHDCRPYLFLLEDDLQYHKALFKLIGVQDEFLPESGLKVLRQIHDENREKSLSKQMINIVNRTAQMICDSVKQSTEDGAKGLDGKHVFLPNHAGVMTNADNLCFRDSPGTRGSSTKQYINNSISPDAAKLLGVKTQKMKTYSSLVKAIAFGQREKLTDRITRLLHGYTFDASLLKELIQNAEDARATEIKFIKNFRHFRTDGIPEGWEKLQGPALCVYNNRSFTSQDIEGIHNLGRGSKRTDLLKTGQYGVGFNAVYHITDTPSFWTTENDEDEVICVFDPSCQYLPDLNPSEPGVKFENIRGVKDEYPNLFAAYAETGVDLQSPGTLFRFPLRTYQAQTSSVNTDDDKWHLKPVTTDQISQLLEQFRAEMGTCLLFLNHIRNIGIYSVSTSGALHLEYSVQKKLTEEATSELDRYNQSLRKTSSHIEEFGPSDVDSLEFPIHMSLTDSEDKVEDWLAVNRIGFAETDDHLKEILQNWDQEKDGKLIPRGAVAVRLSPADRKTDHLVFCMLPLPETTGLPVHINGHFALGHETRRCLWHNKGDNRTKWNKAVALKIVVPAYITALQIVRNAWFPAEEGTNNVSKLPSYHALFPEIDIAQSEIWKELATELYFQIAQQHLVIFPVVRTDISIIDWAPVLSVCRGSAGYFIDKTTLSKLIMDNQNKVHSVFPLQEDVHGLGNRSVCTPSALEATKILHDVLKQLNMKVLDAPYQIMLSFQRSGVTDVQEVSPETVMEFFKSSDFMNDGRVHFQGLPLPVHDTPFKTVSNVKMFLDFLKNDPAFLDNLEGMPLCLRQSEDLHYFEEAEERPIASTYFHLLPNSSAIFLHEQIFRIFLPVSEKNETMIQELDIVMFAKLLPSSFPEDEFKIDQVISVWSFPHEQWLKEAWTFLETQLKENTPRKNVDSENGGRESVQIMISKLNCLYEWCLLPVRGQNEKTPKSMLCPLKCVSCVVHLSAVRTETHPQVWNALRSMPLLLLDTHQLPRSSVVTELVASISHPTALLDALLSAGASIKPSEQHAMYILKYFSDCLPTLKTFLQDQNALREKLRKLPFFKDIEAKITFIPGNIPVVCLKSSIPGDGLVQWSKTRPERIVLLRSEDIPPPLLQFLGFASHTAAHFYSYFLLPTFTALPDSAIHVHVEYLKNSIEKLNQHEKETLFMNLRNIAFIEANGNMRFAKEFFDPHEPVFKVMCPPDRLLPTRYSDYSWRYFLVGAGMISEVTQELFLCFARTLEAIKAPITEDVINKSDTLAQHLFNRKDILQSEFLRQLRNIPFVRPLEWTSTVDGKRLANIADHYREDRLVSLAESCSSKHLYLVWTSICMVHPSADPSMQSTFKSNVLREILHALAWQDEPPKDKVLQHVAKLCKSLEIRTTQGHAWDDVRLVDDVILRTYKYLSQHLQSWEIRQLAHLPLIFDFENKRMLIADSVVFRLSEEDAIPDYIHEAPYRYGMFKEFFMTLGVTQEVTADHYARVLEKLKTQSGEDAALGIEMKIAAKAVRGLFKCLRSKTEDQMRLTVSCLYLPSTNENLMKSTDLIDNTDSRLRERLGTALSKTLHFFIGFGKLNMPCDWLEENETKRLPRQHQMIPLSDVVQEVIPEELSETAHDGNTSDRLRHLLLLPDCVSAFVRVAFHQYRQEASNKSEFNENTENLIKKKLSHYITVKEVRNLQTVLVKKNTVVRESQEKQVSFVVKQANHPKQCIVYLDSDRCSYRDTTPVEHITSLSDAVRFVLEIRHDLLIYFESILQFPANASRMLDRFNFERWGHRSTDETHDCHCSAGSLVPVAEHCHLIYRPDCTFDLLDDVAFEVHDPQVGEDPATEDIDPVYRYAVVTRQVQDNSDLPPFCRRYVIDLGPEQGKDCEVSATRLYKIKRRQKTVPLIDLRELDKTLKDIWRILNTAHQNFAKHSTEFKRVINRLCLHWLPATNTGNEDFCERVTNKIKYYVYLLEREEAPSFGDEVDGYAPKTSQKPSPNAQVYESSFSRMFAQYDRRAQDMSGFLASDSHVTSSRGERAPYPLPREAGRWMRQAEESLAAAKAARVSYRRGYNWICYICHQAVENALKAALYRKDANLVSSEHYLGSIACLIGDHPLTCLVRDLEAEVGRHTSMRYPDVHEYPKIPADVYTVDKATTACAIAEQAVARVRDLLG